MHNSWWSCIVKKTQSNLTQPNFFDWQFCVNMVSRESVVDMKLIKIMSFHTIFSMADNVIILCCNIQNILFKHYSIKIIQINEIIFLMLRYSFCLCIRSIIIMYLSFSCKYFCIPICNKKVLFIYQFLKNNLLTVCNC